MKALYCYMKLVFNSDPLILDKDVIAVQLANCGSCSYMPNSGCLEKGAEMIAKGGE